MSIHDIIDNEWNRSTFTIPEIKLVYTNNRYMAVIDEDSLMIKFIDSEGTIYIALQKNCQQVVMDDGRTVYTCSTITPILCSPSNGQSGVKELFVLNRIIPYLT